MSANRPREYALYVACACSGNVTYTPSFDYTAAAVALGASGNRPLYIALSCAASTSTFMLSTGQQVFWSPIPAKSGAFSVTCTTSGAEYSLNLIG